MAEGIVDTLEAVEIHAKDAEAVACTHMVELVLQLLAEAPPVRKLGERIVLRHVGDLGLRLVARGDVKICRDPASTRHRRMNDRYSAAVRGVEGVIVLRAAFHHQLLVCVQLRRAVRGEIALTRNHVDELGHHHAGLELVLRNREQRAKRLIDHDQPMFCVEHAQPLRHVVQCRVQLHVLGAQLFFLLDQQVVLPLQACIEAFDLRHRAAPLAQIADGVDLEGVQIRAQRLAGGFDRNAQARRGLQIGFPALCQRAGMRRLRTLQKLRDRAAGGELLLRALAQLRGELIGFDDQAVLRDEEGLVLAGNVEGVPDRLRQGFLIVRGLAPSAAGVPHTSEHRCLPRSSGEAGFSSDRLTYI